MDFLASLLRETWTGAVEQVVLGPDQTEAISASTGPTGATLSLAKVSALVHEVVPSMLILDLPWSRFDPDDLEKVLFMLSSTTKVICVDGPSSTAAEVKRIFPTVSQPPCPCVSPRCFWGPSWVMAKRRDKASVWAPGKSCLMLTGSTRSEHYLTELSKSLPWRAKRLADFSWAPGPYSSAAVRASAASNGFALIGPTELGEAKKLANISICRFGVSAMEMMCLGVPTIILPDFQDSEKTEVLALQELGLAIVVEDYRLLEPSVRALIENPEHGARLSRNCLEHFSPPTMDQLTQVFELPQCAGPAAD